MVCCFGESLAAMPFQGYTHQGDLICFWQNIKGLGETEDLETFQIDRVYIIFFFFLD